MRRELYGLCAGVSVMLLAACGSSPRDESCCTTDTLTTQAEEPEPEQDEPVTCPVGSPITVRIAADLDPRVVPAIETATKEWRAALHSSVTFDIRVGDPQARSAYRSCNINVVWNFERTTAFGSAIVKKNDDGNTTASAVVYFHQRVIGDRMDDSELLHALMVHELGHALGLEHDQSRDHETAMWPFVTVPGQIGCEDVRRACTIWSCKPSCEGDGWVTSID